jgi:mono/diheme cytochrome c family protein
MIAHLLIVGRRYHAMHSTTVAVTIIAMIAEFPGAAAVAQTIDRAPFTETQADAGRQSYMDNCASCHSDDLSGKGAPALVGKEFAASQIGQLTTAQLYAYIQGTMPYDQAGSLSSDTYLNILAFILEANGAKPSNQLLTAATSVEVGEIITGVPPINFLAEPK